MDAVPSPPQLTLRLLPGEYSVAQPEAWPDWLPSEGVVAVMRTAEELSVVCGSQAVPEGVRKEGGWTVVELVGPFPFQLTGILDSVLHPLAQAKIGIFALSTFNTDYVLVKQVDVPAALSVLRAAGHTVLI